MAWYSYDPEVRRIATFIAGVVAGAVFSVALMWIGSMLDFGGDTSSSESPDSPAVLGTEAADPAAAEPRTRAPCRSVFRAQAEPLRTAAASLEGWRTHVEAMNQLVAGEITLDQASDYWNRTRRQAADRLARYDAADRDFDARTMRCPRPADAQADTAVGACSQAVRARGAVLRRADIALETWREHVHHMEMLRAGTMSADRATELWQQSWRAGLREIQRYDAAADRASSRTC